MCLCSDRRKRKRETCNTHLFKVPVVGDVEVEGRAMDLSGRERVGARGL